MSDLTPPRRVLLTKDDRAYLRHLADNAEAFSVRADESGADPDSYDLGAATLLADYLRFQAGDSPTPYLIEILAD